MKSNVRFVRKYSPNINRPGLAGKPAVAQMASDIIDLAANAGSVTADDLFALGWPRPTIDQLGSKARERAATQAAG